MTIPEINNNKNNIFYYYLSKRAMMPEIARYRAF